MVNYEFEAGIITVDLYGFRQGEENVNITLDANSVALIAGVGGAIIGAYATYLGAVKLYRVQARDEVAQEIFDVFAPLLDSLRRDGTQTPYHVLGDTACAQRLVARKALIVLPFFKRRRFKKAWREYIGVEYPTATTSEAWLKAFPSQYLPDQKDKDGHKKSITLSVERLERILDAAK